MKLLGSLLLSSAVMADGDMGMSMGDHSDMGMGGHSDMDMDMNGLEEIAVDPTDPPTTAPHTTYHPEYTTHHDENMTHYEEYDHEDHHEDHHEEEHEKEPTHAPPMPCNNCGCNAAEMAEWKHSMMAWRKDHQGEFKFVRYFTFSLFRNSSISDVNCRIFTGKIEETI